MIEIDMCGDESGCLKRERRPCDRPECCYDCVNIIVCNQLCQNVITNENNKQEALKDFGQQN